MFEFLKWVEGSALGHAMRESGVWTYGVVNLLHILGVATLFGPILLLDLRLLGAWRKIPLAAIGRPATFLAGAGASLALLSGLGLLATKATEYADNPFFYIKFPAILLGLLNALALLSRTAWKQHPLRELLPGEQRQLAIFGGISLLCWLTATAAGRMIGYW